MKIDDSAWYSPCGTSTCLESQHDAGSDMVALRATAVSSTAVLEVTGEEWRAFLRQVKAGAMDSFLE